LQHFYLEEEEGEKTMSRLTRLSDKEGLRPQPSRPIGRILLRLDTAMLDRISERAAAAGMAVPEWIRFALDAEIHRKK
jgi:hypothetical protein